MNKSGLEYVTLGDGNARLRIAKQFADVALKEKRTVDDVCAMSLLRTLMEPHNGAVPPNRLIEEFLEIYKLVLMRVWIGNKQ